MNSEFNVKKSVGWLDGTKIHDMINRKCFSLMPTLIDQYKVILCRKQQRTRTLTVFPVGLQEHEVGGENDSEGNFHWE